MWGCWILLDSLWDSLPQCVLFCNILIFVLGYHTLIVHRLLFCILVCPCGGWTLWCQFLNEFSMYVTGGKVHCILSLSILVHTFLIGPFTWIFSCSLAAKVVRLWFHCDCIFSGVYSYVIVCALVKFGFCHRLHWKHCRCIFECGYLVNDRVIEHVLYLCALGISMLVPV